MSFTVILVNVLALVLLAIPGYFLIKTRLTPDLSGGITNILLYVCQPVLTFVSFQKIAYSKEMLKNLGLVGAFSLVGMLIVILLSFLIFSKFKDQNKAKAYKYGAVFSNCAFMGIPFLQSVFGKDNPEIIVYATIFIAVFNLLSWTLGAYAISGDKRFINIKPVLLNPPTLALIVSLPLFFLDIHIADYGIFTEKLFDSLGMIAAMLTPLSMIILGMKLAQMNIKEIFLSYGCYFASFIKLIICPLIMMLLLAPFKLDEVLMYSLVFSMAMPTAMTTIMFSEAFGGDAKEASSLALLSTLLSLITIPLIYLIFTGIFF